MALDEAQAVVNDGTAGTGGGGAGFDGGVANLGERMNGGHGGLDLPRIRRAGWVWMDAHQR